MLSLVWSQGDSAPSAGQVSTTKAAIAAAQAKGVRVVLAVYPGSGPNARALAADSGAQFVAVSQSVAATFTGATDFIVGNEPNGTIFMSPVDPALFTKVLANAYAAIKSARPDANVIGVGLSPRGSGDPRNQGGGSLSMFPVQYLLAMGKAYRDQGLSGKIMDAISFHPYAFPEDKAPDRTSDWPTIGMADLARLKQAISDAFSGTGQKTVEGGLPIHLDEVAYQVATYGKPGYTGGETVKLVDEATQAKHYAQIINQVTCDPSIASLSFLFVDETDGARFQSGFLDAGLAARPVVAAVKQALADTAGGTRCTGTPVNWVLEGGVVGFDSGFSPDGRTAVGPNRVWGFRPTTEEDATFAAGVFPAGETAADAGRNLQARRRLLDSPPLFKVQGSIKAMLKGLAKFELTGKSGAYVYAISVTSVTNPTRSETVVSEPFTVGTGAAECGKSAPAKCKANRADADRNPENGCEVNLLTDPRNCGAVGRIVPTARFAAGGCKNGAAAITKCVKGRYDLDRMVANGCESTVPPAPKKKKGK